MRFLIRILKEVGQHVVDWVCDIWFTIIPPATEPYYREVDTYYSLGRTRIGTVSQEMAQEMVQEAAYEAQAQAHVSAYMSRIATYMEDFLTAKNSEPDMWDDSWWDGYMADRERLYGHWTTPLVAGPIRPTKEKSKTNTALMTAPGEKRRNLLRD